MTVHVRIAANGRLCIPAGIRKRLGLMKGGDLTLDETPDGLVLRTREQGYARAQAIARKWTEGKPGASAEDFLSNRKADWGE